MTKTYDLNCPVAAALDVIGERWTLLIVRDLLLHGPRRFQDFQESLVAVSPNTLAARLKTLEANGIVKKDIYQTTPIRARYVLTAKGRSLGAVMFELRKWGNAHAHALHSTR
ncbi:MAG: helix-turn-helix domain-containing protein [Pseudomonadota bacterium]